MKTILKTTGASALLGMLLIAPFMTMEIVNRQSYHEEFPFALFFALWFNLFAIGLILLPIVRGRRRGTQAEADPVPARRNSLLTNPKPALVISLVLFLCPLTLRLLDSLGWGEPLNRLFNGPNPEGAYVPGLLMAILVFLAPLAAGIIAGRPIVHSLRAGGSLFAHPLHLVLIVLILFTYAASVGSLIIDQWPCFMGVRMCD